jgi:hypothetical protein
MEEGAASEFFAIFTLWILKLRRILGMFICLVQFLPFMSVGAGFYEAHVPAAQEKTPQHTWVQGTDVDEDGPQGTLAPPGSWAQETVGQRRTVGETRRHAAGI